MSLVDLVVTMNFNLYADLLDLVGETDPMFSTPPSPIYAATVRRRHDPQRKRIESYGYPFEISKPLPSIPIWLDQSNGVTLDLEASYEETCRALRIS